MVDGQAGPCMASVYGWCMAWVHGMMAVHVILGLVYYLDGGVVGLVRLDLWVGVGSGGGMVTSLIVQLVHRPTL